MERMKEECPEGFSKHGTVFDSETLYWAGYLYRYWHFYTGESSKVIYKQADAQTVNAMYYGYHTLDIEMAIDRLKEVKKSNAIFTEAFWKNPGCDFLQGDRRAKRPVSFDLRERDRKELMKDISEILGEKEEYMRDYTLATQDDFDRLLIKLQKSAKISVEQLISE